MGDTAQTQDKGTPASSDKGQNAPSAPSINDIASEFNIKPTQTQPGQSNDRQASTPDPKPTKPDSSKKSDDTGSSDLAAQVAGLRSDLARTREEMAAEKAATRAQQDQVDLDNIVSQLAKKIDGVKNERLIRYAFADQYHSDEVFRAIVDSRHTKPAALQKALDTIAPKIQADLAIQVDPQLRANQRAMQNATSGRSTPTENPKEKYGKFIGMNTSDFDREWRRIKSGAYDGT